MRAWRRCFPSASVAVGSFPNRTGSPIGEATGKACGVPGAMPQGQSRAPPSTNEQQWAREPPRDSSFTWRQLMLMARQRRNWPSTFEGPLWLERMTVNAVARHPPAALRFQPHLAQDEFFTSSSLVGPGRWTPRCRSGRRSTTWILGGYRYGHTPGTATRHTFGGLSDAAFRIIPLIEAGRAGAWPWQTTQQNGR